MLDIEPFIAGFGKPFDNERPSADLVRDYEGLVPVELIEFWQGYGFGGYARGLVWIVDPRQFQEALVDWLPTKSGEAQAVPVARSAFGNFICWHDSKFIFVDVHYDRQLGAGDDVELLFNFFLADEKSRRSILHEPLFRKALRARGQLARDEMYAFGLPLAMGGSADVKNIDKAKVLEHLSILAQVHGKA